MLTALFMPLSPLMDLPDLPWDALLAALWFGREYIGTPRVFYRQHPTSCRIFLTGCNPFEMLTFGGSPWENCGGRYPSGFG